MKVIQDPHVTQPPSGPNPLAKKTLQCTLNQKNKTWVMVNKSNRSWRRSSFFSLKKNCKTELLNTLPPPNHLFLLLQWRISTPPPSPISVTLTRFGSCNLPAMTADQRGMLWSLRAEGLSLGSAAARRSFHAAKTLLAAGTHGNSCQLSRRTPRRASQSLAL